MQFFQESVAQMFDQIYEIISNASLFKFVYYCHSTCSYNTDYENHSLSKLHQCLILYLQNISDKIQSEDDISDLISD